MRGGPRAFSARDGVIFVCAAGSRRNLAAQLALAAGRQTVYNLQGGTQVWKGAGLPSVRPAAQPAS